MTRVDRDLEAPAVVEQGLDRFLEPVEGAAAFLVVDHNTFTIDRLYHVEEILRLRRGATWLEPEIAGTGDAGVCGGDEIVRPVWVGVAGAFGRFQDAGHHAVACDLFKVREALPVANVDAG